MHAHSILCSDGLFSPVSSTSINMHPPHVAAPQTYIILAYCLFTIPPSTHSISKAPETTSAACIQKLQCSSFSYSFIYPGNTGQAPRPSSTLALPSTIYPSSHVTMTVTQTLAGQYGISSGVALRQRSPSRGSLCIRTYRWLARATGLSFAAVSSL